MIYTLSYIIISIGVGITAFGVAGIYKFKNFYPRILVASKVDTVGVITIIFGIALRHGVSFFSAKVLLIMAILLVLNPLVAHVITRSAYLSGCSFDTDKEQKRKKKEKEKREQ